MQLQRQTVISDMQYIYKTVCVCVRVLPSRSLRRLTSWMPLLSVRLQKETHIRNLKNYKKNITS